VPATSKLSHTMFYLKRAIGQWGCEVTISKEKKNNINLPFLYITAYKVRIPYDFHFILLYYIHHWRRIPTSNNVFTYASDPYCWMLEIHVHIIHASTMTPSGFYPKPVVGTDPNFAAVAEAYKKACREQTPLVYHYSFFISLFRIVPNCNLLYYLNSRS